MPDDGESALLPLLLWGDVRFGELFLGGDPLNRSWRGVFEPVLLPMLGLLFSDR